MAARWPQRCIGGHMRRTIASIKLNLIVVWLMVVSAVKSEAELLSMPKVGIGRSPMANSQVNFH